MLIEDPQFPSFCILHSAFCISTIASLRFSYPQAFPWVILLLVCVALFTMLMYRSQIRQIPRSLRWCLPMLRITAVSAVALSILRPVITRPRVADERPPILILLDNSASMGVVDVNRSSSEWVGITAALGRLPADARDKQLDAVQAGCDRLSAQADNILRARAELDYAKISGRGVDTAEERLRQAIQTLQSSARDTNELTAFMKADGLDRTLAYLDRLPAGVDRETWLDRIRDKARAAAAFAEQIRIASDGKSYRLDSRVRDACESLQSLTRLQLCTTAVLDRENGLIARLGNNVPVVGFGIGEQLTSIDLHTPKATVDALSPDGSISNLTGEIRQLLKAYKVDPPRAIVLFSDGRLTNADGDSAMLSALAGVPVYTIGAATRIGLKDISIVSATVPSKATIGETIEFSAEIRGFGLRNTMATVHVTGGGPDESRRVILPDDRPVTISFKRSFLAAGLMPLTMEIDSVLEEVSLRNNKVQRWVNVSAHSPTPGATTHPATRSAMETEMADLTGDEGWLRRLSESTGGEFLRLDQVDLLPKKLSEIPEDDTHPIEMPLWDGPYLFVLVLGCLAAEWGLRKRYGLI